VWVFDDEALGIHREPFVGDINKMIDAMLGRAGLPVSEQFTALFSANSFPGYHMPLEWSSEESGGNWYFDHRTGLRGWLCPVLFKFFCEAPENIYVRAEP
jgi:hypothetical protein